MRALITGVTGQDGHYLSQFLLGLGYEVYGLVRRTSQPPRVPHGVKVVEGDLLDETSIDLALLDTKPDEIYNLAAQSHVGTSFKQPDVTEAINADGARYLIHEALTQNSKVKIYQASTSEMFGGDSDQPLDESSPFNPKSPYAKAKLEAHACAQRHRKLGGFVSCGILFNHESPLRGEQFVTRKVTRAIGRIKVGLQDELVLGNLDAVRDWGFAGDYVQAMWAMLQAPRPDDYVIGTGVTHSVREFVETAFAAAGLDWKDYVTTSESEHRPNEVPSLCADPRKAERELGWKPLVNFEQLVKIMVESDIRGARNQTL